MEAIEQANVAVLKDVLPKIYARPQLDKTMLGELIDLFSNIDLMHKHGEAKDLLGRAYEYFISQFAGAEGKRGGEFFTPRSVVRTIVAMLEPTKGRVYDPCCGSGGMFVQSEAFVEEHQGKRSDIAIYGQERNHTTWRLCKMNLAVRGIDADIKWNNEGSFIRDEFPQLKFDYVMANPPFNISDWWQGSLDSDARWAFGTPPQGNANFAWLQHIGLSAEELAFYDALAENDSALEAMGDEKLRVIAHELLEHLRANVTVDWQHRESARARMRILVKRILKRYGYPPDLADDAVQTVLAQAEILLREVTAHGHSGK